MNKQLPLIILLVVCTILSLTLATINYSHATKECDIPVIESSDDSYRTDFDSLNYADSFEVSDFAQGQQNTLDIASKVYQRNKITVLDSQFTISKDLQNRIYETIKDYGASSSFYIVSLKDSMSVGYNVDSRYETASSIKAPYALYVYKEIDKGNIDPNQLVEYKERHENKGTGVVKNSEFGTEFTVRDLVYYSIHESDNVAHIMLHNTFGVSGYNKMLSQLGAKQLYLTAGNPWGFTSSRAAALVWQEIYNFSIRSDEGITFLNILSNAKFNYFKEIIPNVPSASKAGFANASVIETGIVFGEHPYIAICMANKGGKVGAYTQILKLIGHMNEIMVEYDEYLDEN